MSAPRLPDWPAGTVCLLATAGEPHAIPVSTALRAGDREILLALGSRRGALERLRADPRVALAVLAAGDLAFTAHGSAAVAADPLEGHDTTFGQGFSAAREHTGVIFQWSLVTFTVGAILSAIQALSSGSDNAGAAIAGTVASAIAGFAWAVASFFVIPIIALKGVGPKDALKESVAVVKERWGEGVVGNAAIGLAVFVIVFLPAILIGVGGFLLLGSAEALGLALIAVAAVGIAIGSLFNFTITTVFRVALYRYATEGKVIGDFSEEAMADAFAPRHGRRGHAAA
ncbi:MAG: DUF6159 family protein [Solirubrobacterales bacterium]